VDDFWPFLFLEPIRPNVDAGIAMGSVIPVICTCAPAAIEDTRTLDAGSVTSSLNTERCLRMGTC